MSIRPVLTLLTLGCIGLAALIVPLTAPRSPAPKTGVASGRSATVGADVAAFQAIVSRLANGEPYYETVGDELRRRGYPTSQAFNWRTPLLFSALAATPEPVSRGVLIALGLLLCFASITAIQPIDVAATAGTLQLGTMILIVVPFALFIGEVWAGVFIGLSVCAYVGGRSRIAMPLGLIALFVREIAAPYCVACTIVAVASRRWREVTAWLAGACLYAFYYGWHLTELSAQRLPTDLAHSSSWLQMGGLSFLMATIRWHWLLLISPRPLVALALVLIVAGIVNPRAPVHVRLTSGAYALFFLVAGQSFNGYWGLIAWPTWVLACGYGAQEITESVRAIARRNRALSVT